MEIPAPHHPFTHRVHCQMRFNDYDVLGHLNNTSYFALCDIAKMRYFMDRNPAMCDWRSVPMVIGGIKADFYAPCLPDEPLDVLTQTVKTSEHTVTLEQRIVNPSRADEVKAIVRTTLVYLRK